MDNFREEMKSIQSFMCFKMTLHKDVNQLALGSLLRALFSQFKHTPTIPTCWTFLATHCLKCFHTGEESRGPQFIPLLMKEDETKAQSWEHSSRSLGFLLLGSSPTFPSHFYFHQTRLFFFPLGFTY